jgi:hypothetical protein
MTTSGAKLRSRCTKHACVGRRTGSIMQINAYCYQFWMLLVVSINAAVSATQTSWPRHDRCSA